MSLENNHQWKKQTNELKQCMRFMREPEHQYE